MVEVQNLVISAPAERIVPAPRKDALGKHGWLCPKESADTDIRSWVLLRPCDVRHSGVASEKRLDVGMQRIAIPVIAARQSDAGKRILHLAGIQTRQRRSRSHR